MDVKLMMMMKIEEMKEGRAEKGEGRKERAETQTDKRLEGLTDVRKESGTERHRSKICYSLAAIHRSVKKCG